MVRKSTAAIMAGTALALIGVGGGILVFMYSADITGTILGSLFWIAIGLPLLVYGLKSRPKKTAAPTA